LNSVIERRNPGTRVWFRDDILDTLSAVDSANWDVAQHIETSEMQLYRKGYEAAIRATALAFGLSYTPRSQIAEFPDSLVAASGSY